MSLDGLLKARVQASPGSMALWTRAGPQSFAELDAEVTARQVSLEAALGEARVAPGQPVALSLPNQQSFAAGLLALRGCGRVVALVSPQYRAGELRAILEGAGVAAWLTSPTLAGQLVQRGVARDAIELTCPGRPAWALARAATAATPLSESTARAAVLKFSSGTGGLPKGIALTEAHLVAEARQVAASLRLTADDRILATVPLCHSYGFDLGVLAMLASGAGLVLPDLFVPQRLGADLHAHAVSVFLGVPEMYRRWLEIPSASLPALPRLRLLLSCTAPLDVATILAFHARTGRPICQHYGSSETGGATLHSPEDVLARPASVGRPLVGVDLRIVGGDGQPVAPGQDGEVIVRSPAVAAGYVMGAADPSHLRNGEFRTGDTGHVDGDGFLYLGGRLDQIVNVAGFKVAPAEVRDALQRHAAVREAAVIGVAAEDGRSRIWAAVVLREAATVDDLAAHCRRELAAYKVPDRIQLLDALPRGPTGKVRLRPTDFPGPPQP